MLPTTADARVAYVLAFIASHDRTECKAILDAEDAASLEPDRAGGITLNVQNRTFTITLPELVGLPIRPALTNTSAWKAKDEKPNTRFFALTDVDGTLYTARGAPFPAGANSFWIQQYLSGTAANPVVYRTVIEFYTNNVITAVFKTDENNFGAYGTGLWTVTP